MPVSTACPQRRTCRCDPYRAYRPLLPIGLSETDSPGTFPYRRPGRTSVLGGLKTDRPLIADALPSSVLRICALAGTRLIVWAVILTPMASTTRVHVIRA